ncbi:type II toxin-antitoxin system RatA family toxin [Idiomarina sp.]|uniref:type II toxin-antitoxin system RatA family toxin n=1 Tax=Idiomarina sp. TaxID=1874361 RepID=UPI001D782F29|nr:type II toxin-antitoxin system RatA family toxin [Idiomarina sp.]MCJ8315669.1 type II toxin-antitoxin system RatA family toxin [Idiomarina sp.]NQZ15584.1 type II toxin-antitoxin system RatA family toxin [Idiomarina sp.]
MPSIEKSALVSYSAEQMFNLVNDIDSYPEFVPGCADSRVVEQNGDYKVASLQISKAGIQKTFTTRNRLVKPERIDMELVDGPFKKLTGGWVFKPLSDDACKVELKLDFEFSSRLLSMAFGKIFSEVTSKMVDAFVKRAEQVYGN